MVARNVQRGWDLGTMWPMRWEASVAAAHTSRQRKSAWRGNHGEVALSPGGTAIGCCGVRQPLGKTRRPCTKWGQDVPLHGLLIRSVSTR